MKLLYFYSFSIFLLFGCSKSPDRSIIPNWSSDLLGPLVKTKITGEQVLQLQDLSSFTFSSQYDFGYGKEGQPDSIPEITLPNIVQSAQLNSSFINMELERGTISFRIVNTLDIDFKKGAVITFKQNGSTLLTDTLRHDLAAHGGVFNSREVSLAGKTIYPNFDITISNLGTHGTHGQPLIPGDKKLAAYLSIRDVAIKSLTIPSGSYTISDTSNFNLNGRVIHTGALSGDIYSYVKNNFGFTTDVQFYFLDPDRILIDSLFSGHVFIPPATPADTEFVYRQPVSENKLPNISKAFYINSVARFYSSSQVTIRKENFMNIQLVGDIKITVNKK